MGASSPEPELTDEQENWQRLSGNASDREWAMHWLRLGGFEPSAQGAAQFDSDGWLPLHHAIQATVHWTKAHDVCRGLMMMMDDQLLRAKTRGGRPAGYTALHLASNNSDRIFERRFLVDCLLKRDADVNARDLQGRTLLHLAAGTGVVDVAKVLVRHGADMHAVDNAGKNALDRAMGCSGQMKTHSVKFVRA